MELVLGIDVGTTEVRVAAAGARAGGAVVEPVVRVPAAVGLGAGGCVVGAEALALAQLQPERVAVRWKWLLGRAFHSQVARRTAFNAGRELARGTGQEAWALLGGEAWSPVDLAAQVLARVHLEVARGEAATPAVVLAVPAAFGGAQMAALGDAAQRVGLPVERWTRDTTAVALAEIPLAFEGTAVVVDAGAGKLEVAVVDAGPGLLDVCGRRCDPLQGGDELDARLVEWLVADIEHATREALDDDARVREFLRQECEAAKRADLGAAGLRVRAPFLEGVGGRGLDATWELPPARVHPAVLDLVEEVAVLCELALEDAGLRPTDVSRVILAGGLGHLDELRARMAAFWHCAPTLARPDAVARGAALYGAALHGAAPRRMVREDLGHAAPGAAAPSVAVPPPALAADVVDLSAITGPPPPPAPAPPPAPVSVAPVSVAPVSVAPVVPLSARSHATTIVPPPPERPIAAPVVPPPPGRPTATTPPERPVAPGESQRSLASSLPPGVAPRALPSVGKAGRFRGVRTAAELLALGLARPPSGDDREVQGLPALLVHLTYHKDLTADVVLSHGADSFPVTLFHGSPTMTGIEAGRAQRAFLWSEGHYTVTRRDDVVPSPQRPQTPMVGFVVSGLRPVLRAMDDGEIVTALAARMPLSPEVNQDRRKRIARLALMSHETRMLEHEFDGERSLEELLHGATSSRSTLLRLALVLEAFDCIAWTAPRGRAEEDPATVLALRLARMQGQNHFDVLAVHWSVSRDEVAKAWTKFQAEYGPGGPWHRVSAEMARAALARGTAAWEVLADNAQRLRHRREAYPDIDTELLAPLVESRAGALAMRGDVEEAQDMRRLLGEIAPGARVGPLTGIPTRGGGGGSGGGH